LFQAGPARRAGCGGRPGGGLPSYPRPSRPPSRPAGLGVPGPAPHSRAARRAPRFADVPPGGPCGSPSESPRCESAWPPQVARCRNLRGQVRPTGECGSCAGEPRGSRGRHESACAGGNRGSSPGGGCSAGKCACSRSISRVLANQAGGRLGRSGPGPAIPAGAPHRMHTPWDRPGRRAYETLPPPTGDPTRLRTPQSSGQIRVQLSVLTITNRCPTVIRLRDVSDRSRSMRPDTPSASGCLLYRKSCGIARPLLACGLLVGQMEWEPWLRR
jgi:hypothetical protein